MRRLVVTFIAGTLAAVGFGTPTAGANDETKVEPHVVETEVHFDFDSAALSDSAKAELDKAADWLVRNPDATIVIEGYADRAGPEAYNKRLAMRRAEAARAYLIEHGAPASRIEIIAYGEAGAAVNTPKRERLNRRIELIAVEKEPIIEKQTVTETERVEVPVEHDVIVPKVVERERVVTRSAARDLDVMAGGGVTGFIDSNTRDATDVGGAWTARVVGRTHHYLGYEAAYVGSTQGISAFDVNPDARLIGQGAEANLRINFTRHSALQPYIFGGVGLSLYDVSHMEASLASMEEDDNVVHIPAGAGLRVELPARLVLDVRGTYRAAFDDTMFQGMGGNDGLQSWSATGQLGMSF